MSRPTDPSPSGLVRPSKSEGLARRLARVREALTDAEHRVPLDRFGDRRESARNLIHYLALRQFDLRPIQDRLARLGLSSLGRSESHVLYNLDAVRARLDPGPTSPRRPAMVAPGIDPEEGRRRIARNASSVFGRPAAGRSTRIMVTLPSEAARDPALVRRLVGNGMDLARINCAHDSPEEWEAMIRQVRIAGRRSGRSIRIEMDLGGPRLRTAALPPGPAVLKLRPERDAFGRVTSPARLLLRGSGDGSSPDPGARELTVRAAWFRRRRVGETIRLTDARGSSRSLRIASRSNGTAVALATKTTYLTNGTVLRGRRRGSGTDPLVVQGVPARPGRLRLARGSWIRLVDGVASPEKVQAPTGARPTSEPAVGVTLPAALRAVRPGQRVWFDGGRIQGVARSRLRDGVRVRVERTPPGGAWLRGDQGINLPDTHLDLPPLSARDRADLRFAVAHADLVGVSFVQSSEDVEGVRGELRRLGRPKMGLVLKIETGPGFERLPEILLSGLRSGPTAVMVARGDLAVEVGFERLAEVQEEILWLCEAAHVPAVWATQVLEGLAHSGIPSRAEVTDAAMGERAECVMLNKGPFLAEAVRALDSIVRRMEAHQAKKSSRLRHLAVAEEFLRSIDRPATGTR